jgi:thiamine biosynthesis protein ThiS
MITVNDKFDIAWEEGLTVSRLLEQLKFSFPLIIVSVNGMLVPKDQYASRQIPDGAEVKVLHMTAGG